MARKNITPAFEIVTAGDMSADFVSRPIPIEYLDNIGIQLEWTGSPNGNFFVDGRVHPKAPWTELVLTPPVAASGSAGDWLISLLLVPYAELQLRFVMLSGTGTLTAWAMCKQVGG